MSILNNIMEILSGEQRAQLRDELDKVELATMNLKEGTEIHAESFEKGEAVHIVTEDNEKIPLPEGEYELEDGRRIVMDAQSMIEEVKSQEQKSEENEEEENVEQTQMGKDEEKEDLGDDKEEDKDKMGEDEKIKQAVKKEFDKLKEELKSMVREEMESYTKKVNAGEKEENKEEMSAQAQYSLPPTSPKKFKPNPDKEIQNKPLGTQLGKTNSVMDNVLLTING